MKRALIAAVVGGLVMFFVPQAATADHNAEHKSDCAGQPAGASESPEQQTPPERAKGDSEEEHSDGGEILF
jgi:hypothetical protein